MTALPEGYTLSISRSGPHTVAIAILRHHWWGNRVVDIEYVSALSPFMQTPMSPQRIRDAIEEVRTRMVDRVNCDRLAERNVDLAIGLVPRL